MNDELERDREERLLKFAALAGQEQEDKEYEAFLRSDEYVPPDEAWMKKVTGELRRPPKRRPVHWKKLVVMAAAIVVLLCAGVGTAIANPKALANLFSQDYERYSQVRVDDGVVLEKPEGWESEYYPTWAPSGFSIKDFSENGNTHNLTLSSKNDAQIEFAIYDNRTYGFSNTEKLSTFPVTIFEEEYTAYLSEDGLRVLMVIPNEGASIVIDGELTPEQLVKFAENIKNLN